jgi:hypothetical protein
VESESSDLSQTAPQYTNRKISGHYITELQLR